MYLQSLQCINEYERHTTLLCSNSALFMYLVIDKYVSIMNK